MGRKAETTPLAVGRTGPMIASDLEEGTGI